jgi:outer membrane protein assembly factor BamD
VGLVEFAHRQGGPVRKTAEDFRRSHWWRAACAVVLVVSVAVIGCGPSGPVLSADPTGTTLFEEGKLALDEENWNGAAKALDTLLKNYPASPYLAESRLGLGLAYYEQGRADTLILGIDAFQGFLTYHPTHPRADYAQYMVGMSYMRQMRSADRDQLETRNALGAFDRFVEMFPDSSLMPEALKQRQVALDRLADSELRVARWQLDARGLWEAAASRAEEILEIYPDSSYRCDLLFLLGESYKQGQKLGEAVEYYEEVVNDHPDCEFAQLAGERLTEIGSTGPGAQGVGRDS